MLGGQAMKKRSPVMNLRKLIRKGDGSEEIEQIVKTLAKYTNAN